MITSLQSLSSLELEQSLFKLIGQERKLLHMILFHIQEIERRRLYLKTRSSLFEYLVKDMGYSATSAQRRIEALRLINEVPEVSEQIKSGSLNLSQVGELVRAVKQKEYESCSQVSVLQKTELVEAIQNRTHFETQRILASALDIIVKTREIKKIQKDESVRLELTLSQEQYEKLLECRDLASHVLLKEGSVELSEVIGYLSEFYLNKKNLVSKNSGIKAQGQSDSDINLNSKLTLRPAFSKAIWVDVTAKANAVSRRTARANTRATAKTSPKKLSPNKSSSQKNEEEMDKSLKTETISSVVTVTVLQGVNKSITSKTRRMIRLKFQCCQHQDQKTGTKCQSRFQLEVDHIVPRWDDGTHEESNLTLLCRAHNLERYRRQSGFG
jgi:hypothetical protein